MPALADMSFADAKKALADRGIKDYDVVADGPGNEAQDGWVVAQQYPAEDFLINESTKVELTVADPDETPAMKAERIAAEKKAAEEAAAKAEAEKKAAAKKKAEEEAKKKAEDEAKKKAAAAKLKPRVYEGYGDDVIKIKKFDADMPQVAILEHTGYRNFIVSSLDSNMEDVDLLANTIGNYSGTVYFDEGFRSGTTSLEIQADGAWKVTLVHPEKVKEHTGSKTIKGAGDTVFRYTGDSGIASITHSGARNFIVQQSGDSGDLLINEIGAYDGTVRFPGSSLYEIKADGAWTISLED